MIKRLCKRVLCGILTIGLLAGSVPLTAFADVQFNRMGEGILVSPTGTKYYYHISGGGKAYIPIKNIDLTEARQVANGLLKLLPGMQTGFGSHANTAAFRYQGFNAYVGSQAQYLVKTTQQADIPFTNAWRQPQFNVNGGFLSFRYAGMVINQDTGTGDNTKPRLIAGTNPEFTSDFVSMNPGEGTLIPVTKYAEAYQDGVRYVKAEQINAYSVPSYVWQLINMYNNGMYGTSVFASQGNILTNAASGFNKNEATAKKAFEMWAENSEYGRAYQAEALDYKAQTGSPLQWWQILNQYFQINGDPNDNEQTVYFYMVKGKKDGVIRYRTYAMGNPGSHNVSPTFLAVIDNETNEIVGSTQRDQTFMDPNNGLRAPSKATTARLQAGKFYTVVAVMDYYSLRSDTSKTDRSINFYSLSNLGSATPESLDTQLIGTGDLTGQASSLNDVIDRKSFGKISTGNRFHTNADSVDAGKEYVYMGAAFTTKTFQATDTMLTNGHGYLAVSVPDAFVENGDNDFLSDDLLTLPYTIVTEEVVVDSHAAVYGDLNLGQREYRSLHYITEIEEESDDDEDDDDGGDGGDDEDDEPEMIEVEMASDYGTYEDASSTPISNEYRDPVREIPNGKTIWNAGSVSDSIGDAWWEYTDEGEWPDQNQDLDYKCWLTDAGGTWIEDGEFLRSINGENHFGFGFRVSRSRGDAGTTLGSAAVETKIYGVSPDTGDEGVLLSEYLDGSGEYRRVYTGSIPAYGYSDAFLTGIVSSKSSNGIEDFPFIRVVAEISKEVHGESQIHSGRGFKDPAENSWQEEHDTVDRTFGAEMDDMRIMEVEIKDSEGIVIYHADRYNSDEMETIINGYYDREEDLFMKVVVEQCLEKGHRVKNPTIDVYVKGVNEEGYEMSTYVNTTYCQEGVEMGEGVQVTFDDIAFRPKAAHKLQIDVEIDDIHGEDNWRENIWEHSDDVHAFTLEGTTADLALSQDIELYNSKNNRQDFITFGENLNFRYDIRHIGTNERQTAIVGGSEINPFAKVDVALYNADALTLDPVNYTIMYRMASQDPKAASALIKSGEIQAATRLYPGLGINGYASHVQAWYPNYVAQSYRTDTGNIAAYGHVLATGNVNAFHDSNNTNIRNNSVDWVQKEFFGEKNFKIVDIGVTSRNSVSPDTGIAVQVAIENEPSSYNDQTVIDKTYLDIYVDDEHKKTIEVEIPVGDTVVTEAIIDNIDLTECRVVEARVNTGKRQTHYEYVLRATNAALYPDPFVDNYMSIVVCANKPNETVCPTCIIDDTVAVDNIFATGGVDSYIPVLSDTNYNILFEANDGSSTNATQTVPYESTRRLTANTFSREGYVFSGWNTSQDGSGRSYADNEIINVGSKASYGGDTTLTLYAQWNPITYTIKFHPNGGSGTMAPISLTFDVTRYLPANSFTNGGYVFAGWNTSQDGTGIYVTDGGSVRNFSTTNGAEVTLYAQWMSTADCIISENFSAAEAQGLAPGDIVAENPSLISMVRESTYGYIRVKIPTVSAQKGSDTMEKVYDLFEPNWNTTDWTLVQSTVSGVAGEDSVYIWRYNDILAPVGTSQANSRDSSKKANQTTVLFNQLKVGNFSFLGSISVSTELVGVVVDSASASIGTVHSPGTADLTAFAALEGVN